MLENFDYLDTSKWQKATYSTPYTDYKPENVSVIGGILECTAPANVFEGGELLTLSKFGYGSYRTRLKISNVPNTIFSFYLYNHKAGNPDEIDVEFYGSTPDQVSFNSWKDGVLTSIVIGLAFDASLDFHTYGFDYYKDRIDFLIDDAIAHTLETNIPTSQMYMLCTAYSPTWIGSPPASEGKLFVDWVMQESFEISLSYLPLVIIVGGIVVVGLLIR